MNGKMTATKMTATEVLPTLTHKFELVIEKDFGKVFLLPDNFTMICELTKEYVPIEDFKNIFSETTAFIKKHQVKKFIFDKQNMRVFHQPSMEWYFLHWKKEIFALGMHVHRKILPQDNPAFTMAVQAGRDKINAENTESIIARLDIKYKTCVKDAIEN